MSETDPADVFAAGPRVLPVARWADAALPEAPLDPDQVLAGAPAVRLLPLAALGDVEVGVWQHGPGTSTDVEADELFVVLAGHAVIEVEDGPTLDVHPGDLVVLTAGSRTTWRVDETLRKLYVAR